MFTHYKKIPVYLSICPVGKIPWQHLVKGLTNQLNIIIYIASIACILAFILIVS